jgi:hypothetical protein
MSPEKVGPLQPIILVLLNNYTVIHSLSMRLRLKVGTLLFDRTQI